MASKLVIYPACLECMWRDISEVEAIGSYGAKRFDQCENVPICKLIEGQEPLGESDEEQKSHLVMLGA